MHRGPGPPGAASLGASGASLAHPVDAVVESPLRRTRGRGPGQERAGFAATDLIIFESKYDDQRWNVFRPGVKGRTDHYIAMFQKPADGKPLR